MFCAPSVRADARLPRRRTRRYMHILHLATKSRVDLASKGKGFCQTRVDITARGHYLIGVGRAVCRRPL